MATDSVSLTLMVDNVDQAIDFYVNRLGLFTTDPERISDLVSLNLAGSCSCFSLGLCDVSSSPELQPLVGNQCAGAIFLTLPIANVEDMEKQLQRMGVQIVDRHELPYAEWLFVVDPFGNKIALCEDLTKACH